MMLSSSRSSRTSLTLNRFVLGVPQGLFIDVDDFVAELTCPSVILDNATEFTSVRSTWCFRILVYLV
jgi:hypothetical protein